MANNDFSYEFKEDFGGIGEVAENGWQKHLTLISWNGREPKYDIRSWNSDMSRMGKGISFTKEELLELRDLLNDIVDEL